MSERDSNILLSKYDFWKKVCGMFWGGTIVGILILNLNHYFQINLEILATTFSIICLVLVFICSNRRDYISKRWGEVENSVNQIRSSQHLADRII